MVSGRPASHAEAALMTRRCAAPCGALTHHVSCSWAAAAVAAARGGRLPPTAPLQRCEHSRRGRCRRPGRTCESSPSQEANCLRTGWGVPSLSPRHIRLVTLLLMVEWITASHTAVRGTCPGCGAQAPQQPATRQHPQAPNSQWWTHATPRPAGPSDSSSKSQLLWLLRGLA